MPTTNDGTGTSLTQRSGTRRALPLLTGAQRSVMTPELLDVIEYRKSGLSVNWIVGCPLDCGYCVRHLFGNFEMKVPRALMRESEAFDRLVTHPYFRPHVTPIQLLNRATDPMLPAVKPHTFDMLGRLDAHGLTNHVLVITRWRVEPADCALLNSFANIKVTLLVTHSGITDPRIEPVDSTIAATSLKTAYERADRTTSTGTAAPTSGGRPPGRQHDHARSGGTGRPKARRCRRRRKRAESARDHRVRGAASR